MALKLSPPWCVYAHDFSAMFKYDPDVKVVFDEEELKLNLYVENPEKADALMQIIPTEKDFGNVKLTIAVIPADKTEGNFEGSTTELMQTAFEGNGAVADIKEVTGMFPTPVTYVLFRKEVVQYFSDNLSDYYGNRSTLYADIAYEIFNVESTVFFCTDIEDPVF